MGLNPVKPTFILTANDQDITATIKDRFQSLRLVDDTGLESDTLEITLADSDPMNRIQRPPKGAEVELWLGYDDSVTRMGLFVFDEFQRSAWPCTVTLRCRAAVYDETTKGKKDLQTQKSRSWPDGTKLGAMVSKIASEHGMQSAVSNEVAAIVLPHYDQTEESDLSFLLRIAKNYDAYVKPAGGKLVMAKRGKGQTVSGEVIPPIRFHVSDLSDLSTNISTRESPGTVVAFWHTTRQSKRIKVTLGSGDPVRQIRHYFPTEEAAKQAAQATLNKLTRGQEKMSCTLPGRPDLMAEGTLDLWGYGAEDVDGEWLVTRVEHEVSESSGYTCRIDGERALD